MKGEDSRAVDKWAYIPLAVVFVLANTMKHTSRNNADDKGPIGASVNF